MASHTLMISFASWLSTQMAYESTSANSLKSSDLPSITGMPAAAPMSPRPSTAVPLVMTATMLRLSV